MSSGIRVNELRLAGPTGNDLAYGAQFRVSRDGGFRPMSIIAGPSQTGKTSIADFIKYCLGGDDHPQHPEIVQAVRAALLEVELDGRPTTIERSATGSPSKFASVWDAALSDLEDATEHRISAEPPSDPDGLSQFVLSACDLNGIELPEAPTKDDSATQLLSIRDVFRIIFVPNERLDNKNLVFEQAHHMVRQKFRQTIDVMFGVHDSEGASLGARQRAAQETARAATQAAMSLRRIAEQDYPRGALQLAQDHEQAQLMLQQLETQLVELDREQRSTEQASQELRTALEEAQNRASVARVRVRDRRSLLSRLSALRGQYADDKRKLNFLRDAERLFDPLQVVVCPACLNELDEPPSIQHGSCSLCGHAIQDPELGSGDGYVDASETQHDGASTEDAASSEGDSSVTQQPTVSASRGAPSGTAVLEAELRAVSRRLDGLNDYHDRLDAHLQVLIEESIRADEEADAAAVAVDRITRSPAPWLALRDDLTRRISEGRLAEQETRAGLNMWKRVDDAEANRDRLVAEAQRLGALRREARARPDRTAIVSSLSARFGQILADIGYPKLSEPFLDDNLVPHVRGLSYTHASSGGLVLISLAWHMALWEVAHERNAAAPGLLVLDSPQKNLGHAAMPGDTDFADATLVENFYSHARTWLAGDGAGAQLIVIDNSPPESVRDDVVVRYTRDPAVEPYGLITDATE